MNLVQSLENLEDICLVPVLGKVKARLALIVQQPGKSRDELDSSFADIRWVPDTGYPADTGYLS